MIGCPTSATTNLHGNARLSPRSGCSSTEPYVIILEPLAAYSSYDSGRRLFFIIMYGNTLTSEPVSTRYLIRVCWSAICRRHGPGLLSLPAINDCPTRFPCMRRVVCISLLLLRNVGGRSKYLLCRVFCFLLFLLTDFVLALFLAPSGTLLPFLPSVP